MKAVLFLVLIVLPVLNEIAGMLQFAAIAGTFFGFIGFGLACAYMNIEQEKSPDEIGAKIKRPAIYWACALLVLGTLSAILSVEPKQVLLFGAAAGILDLEGIDTLPQELLDALRAQLADMVKE